MANHTPGPWYLDSFEPNPKSRVTQAIIRRESANGLPIADCGVTVTQESAANARLIAAAPDLLAALEDAADVLEDAAMALGNPEGLLALSLAKARAAIRKAKGE